MAAELNAWNVRILEEMADLYCFAAYHPGDADGPAMAAAIIDHPQVLGFKLHLLVQRIYPHDERLFALYDLIQDRGRWLLIHTGTGPVGNEFTGIAHFREFLKRYPRMNVIVPHMGALEYAEFGALLDEYPNLHLDTAFAFIPQMPEMGFLGSSPGPAFLEAYQDRILYGSDFPNVLFPREAEIETLLGLNLSQSFYDKVFSLNALRIFAGIGNQRSARSPG